MKNNNLPNGQGKEPKPFNKKLALSLVINSLILTFIYFGAISLEHEFISFAVMIAYLVIFGGLLIAYIVYNRGFSRNGITEDMLPDGWDKEKKKEYLADAIRRKEKSKWMLSVMIPFLVPIAADALYMFLWQGILEPIFEESFLALALSFI